MNKLLERLRLLLLKLQILLLKAKVTIPNLDNPKAIVVHYDGAGNSFDSVNNWHKQKWGFKSSLGFFCGYHYYIEYDGRVIQAREDNEEGAHCVNPRRPGFWNKNSIGICLQGDSSKFTPAQEGSLLWLLDNRKTEYSIDNSEIYTHKDIKTTDCPGTKIDTYIKGYRKRA